MGFSTSSGTGPRLGPWLRTSREPATCGTTFRRRSIWARGAIYAFVFGKVFFWAIPDGAEGSIGAAELIIPVVLMAGAYFLINSFLTDAVQALAGRGTFGHLWLQNLPLVPLYFLASSGGAAVVYLFHAVAGPWSYVLALPILIVAYYAHLFYNDKYEELSRVHKQTLEAFAFCIDAMELHFRVLHRFQTSHLYPYPADASAYSQSSSVRGSVTGPCVLMR